MENGKKDMYVVVKVTISGGGVIEYRYDSFGRVIKSSTVFGDSHTFVSYEYDENGNKIEERHEDNTSVYTNFYEYDKNNRLIKSQDYNTRIYKYDENGNSILEKGEPNFKDYEYDEKGNLVRECSSYGDEVIYQYKGDSLYKEIFYQPQYGLEWKCNLYTYDKKGNLSTSDTYELSSREECEQINEKNKGNGKFSVKYEYDDKSRLIYKSGTLEGRPGITSTTYSYDENGNKKEEIIKNYMDDSYGYTATYEYKALSDALSD
ncbi:hypothetical protein NXH76_17720 [Blautia schinkii]|nr:hypothetical protein [Blautia schinkii]